MSRGLYLLVLSKGSGSRGGVLIGSINATPKKASGSATQAKHEVRVNRQKNKGRGTKGQASLLLRLSSCEALARGLVLRAQLQGG